MVPTAQFQRAGDHTMSKFVASLLAALVLISTAVPASALTFRIEFSGTESVLGGTGSVSVIVDGLADNTANQSASSVIIESFTFGDGTAGDLGQLSEGTDATQWTNAVENQFSVFGGTLQKVEFQASNLVVGGIVGLTQDNLVLADDHDDGVRLRVNQENGLDFGVTASMVSISRVSTVPLPAPILMLLTTLGGLGLLARTRRRATSLIGTDNQSQYTAA